MKLKLQKTIYMLSRYFLYVFLLQIAFINLTLAVDVYAQYKRIDEVLIKLDRRNLTLDQLFKQIETKSDFQFSYDKQDIDRDFPVILDQKRASVEDYLKQVAKQASLSFRQVNNSIDIKKVERPVVEEPSILDVTISGTVTDENGEAIPGVTVSVPGTTIGTATDLDGNYALSVPEGSTLVFSFIGFESQTVEVGDRSVINIILNEDIASLDEVVVVGYGTQKKANLTGSVTIVNAEELEQITVPQLSQGLMGRAPGVFIKNVQGQPGEDGMEINIRGFGAPLIIVDGLPVSKDYFEQLVPNDIESFNVLKDASAAAVYGSKAGNGVILVTTKRGTLSAPQFSYNSTYGLQFFTQVPDWGGSGEYAAMYNVGLLNDNKPPRWEGEEVQKFRDGSDPVNYPNTDWWEESVRNFAPQQQHNLSVRGGTDRVNYFTSLNYFNQRDMHISDEVDYRRFSLRTNIDVLLTEKFTLGVNLSLTNQQYYGPSTKWEWTRPSGFSQKFGYMTRFFRQLPYWPNKPHPDPTKVPAIRSGSTESPYYMGFIEHVGFHEWDRLFGFAKLSFDYELPFGFAAKAVFDINRTYNRERLRELEMPQYDYFPETGEYTVQRLYRPFDYLQEDNNIAKNFNYQYYLTWNKTLNNHQFNALFVHEILSFDNASLMGFRRDYNFNLNYLSAGPDLNKDNAGFLSEGGSKAYISRINYNYLGKYLFEFSSRWDASPNFPPETRWGFFPSFSAGWLISEESFIQNNLPIFSNLKIRASHGNLGYDRAGAFQYLSTYSIQSQFISNPETMNLEPGIRADQIPNPNITWEKMRMTNAGIDFTLGNFLYGTIDYFYRLRTDVLGTRIGAIPDVVGAKLPEQNFFEFDNRGWEFSLSYMNNIKELEYNISGNISTNREKTIFRDQVEFATMEAFRRGNLIDEWTDRFWVFPTDGLFQSQEVIDNLGYDIDGQGNRTIKPGDIKYIDYNGDGRISDEDMILAGRGTMPRLMFGADLSLSWKGFDFMMLWQGAGLFNYSLRSSARDFILPFSADNNPNMYMYENMYVPENPWMPANTTNATWPRFGLSQSSSSHTNFNRHNELWMTDGLYLRLKNVEFGYTIPQRITQRLKINNLKVYVSGYNVLTFHKYPFIDPEANTETNVFGDYHPPMGSYNFGLQLNF